MPTRNPRGHRGAWSSGQAACSQVEQVQFSQVQLLHVSVQLAHSQVWCLHVGQVQFSQVQVAQESLQPSHWHVVHSS